MNISWNHIFTLVDTYHIRLCSEVVAKFINENAEVWHFFVNNKSIADLIRPILKGRSRVRILINLANLEVLNLF